MIRRPFHLVFERLDPAGTPANRAAASLLHYVGAVPGGSGCVRDRAAEVRRRTLPRNQLLARIDRARVVVQEVLPELDDARLAEPFEEAPAGASPVDTGILLVRPASDLAYHPGQVRSQRKLVSGKT